MPLPGPGRGVDRVGGEVVLGRACAAPWSSRETSATPFASITGAPPSSTTVVLPTKAMHLAGELLGLRAVGGGLEAVVGRDQRELAAAHPAGVVDHVEVGLDAVHAGLPEAGHEAA